MANLAKEPDCRGGQFGETEGRRDGGTEGLFCAKLYIIRCVMKIRSHKDLEVYQLSFKSAMKIFELSKRFPKEEIYSLTDQIRRSSRSVCGNLAEAFRKRRYPKAFVCKLSDSEGEAAETQVWLEFALNCSYISPEKYNPLNDAHETIIGKLVNMSLQTENWTW
jgi:four helix bundle protein